MRKLTTEEFIQKAKQIHGDKYDYSQSIYVSIKNKINIICPDHGLFNQLAESHLKGKGCSSCGIKKQKDTCLIKYGNENPFGSKICQEKIKNTMINKYGVSSPIKNKLIKEKIEKTNIKKYGVKNPFQNKIIIQKIQSKLDYNQMSKNQEIQCFNDMGFPMLC
jgi:hypothetical protein